MNHTKFFHRAPKNFSSRFINETFSGLDGLEGILVFETFFLVFPEGCFGEALTFLLLEGAEVLLTEGLENFLLGVV